MSDIRFNIGGEITWVSKSGKTEKRRRVSEGTILTDISLRESDIDKYHWDVKDGNWTVYGIYYSNFTVIKD